MSKLVELQLQYVATVPDFDESDEKGWPMVLIFREKAGSRCMVIGVDEEDGRFINAVVHGFFAETSLIHHVLIDVVQRLGAELSHVELLESQEEEEPYFYSRIYLDIGEGKDKIGIECPPADALPICFFANIPFLCKKELLDKESSRVDSAIGDFTPADDSDSETSGSSELSPEEIKKLAPWHDAVERAFRKQEEKAQGES